jgi:rod shape-determining protein MreC
MRRTNRWVLLAIAVGVCGVLIVLGILGFTAPVEGTVSVPMQGLSGFFNRVGIAISGGVTDVADFQRLQRRNQQLEQALAEMQPELVELREIRNDYERLRGLLDYTTARADQEFVTADVIDVDTSGGLVRTITINRGARDGLTAGMPVVNEQGLIGRIIQVTATAARVLLITDQSSAVNARLQETRVLGSVVGQPGGGLRMELIPIGQEVQEGDIVITSGLGGNFPPDIVLGQVTSVRSFEFELYQTAEVRSLVNFDTLEFVLVITNFTPVDISVFLNEEEATQPQP